MRIGYSCAGEGFGHAARMVALSGDLSLRHELTLFVPGPVAPFVRARAPGLPAEPLPCFELSKRGNRVLYAPTAAMGLAGLLGFLPEVLSLSKRLREARVDAVLSDFEPYLPWAARIAGIPVVQMNHPGIVERYAEADPRSLVSVAMARLMQGPWDRRILVSFFGGDVGPVLRPSLLGRRVRDEGFVAVNLKSDARPPVLPVLDAAGGLRYRLFPAPGADFDEALASCSAVITTAGHQTISEALALGKPVLALPQDGQWEQELNARMLEASGRGLRCPVRDLPRVLPSFLSRLDEFRSPRVIPAGFVLRDSRADLLDALERAFAALVPASAPAPFAAAERTAV